MPISDVYDNKVLDAVFGSSHSSVMPATMYAALYYEEPTKAGGGTEADYGEYVRTTVTNNSSNFPDAADALKSNAVQIDFVVPWGSDYQGTWDETHAYAPSDVVTYSDVDYISIDAGIGFQPDTNPDHWTALTADNVVAVGFHDHATADQLIFFEVLPDPLTVRAGEVLYIPVGAVAFIPPY